MLLESARNRVKYQLEYLETNRNRLVIDGDTHATDTEAMHASLKVQMDAGSDYYHGRPVSAEDLMAEMNMAGVDMALIWQNPAATVYTNHPEADFKALFNANLYIYETALKYPDRFIPAGWTDPKALGVNNAKKLVNICVNEFGFAIVKMNPAQNAFPIDSEPVVEVFDHIVRLGAVPAFHFGADTEFTPAEGLRNLANRFPEHPIIGVHMGGGGAAYPVAEELYQKARLLGLECPNIHFVLSAKRDTHIESDLITYTLAGEQPSSRIFCGSDAPYGRMTWNFGGYRAMFKSLIDGRKHTDSRVRVNETLFTDRIAGKYMGGNLALFMIDAYSRILNHKAEIK